MAMVIFKKKDGINMDKLGPFFQHLKRRMMWVCL